ncbi:helix-turn-helix transcriptional regulator [Paenibacillus sp. Soil787]|uniref:helix-turn-helix transcriptional regulator n=1 Tax=Paenibacillus sp. Soil787 TaxID=1736411 RepID=UPI0006F21197|nr:AraC family transcriptional regulator [Paenibacillus sp. Soil787]KRF39118.1 hypothetical protein ASG93_23420 [Paenibacillus sp. Soil787]
MRLIWRFRRSYFINLVLSYCILAILLIAGIGGYLFTQANTMMLDELTKESQSRLNTAQDLLEKNVLPKYVEGMMAKYFSGVEPNPKDMLYRILDTGWETNMTEIVDLIKQIAFINVANDGISNMSVYVNEGSFAFDRIYFYPSIEESPDRTLLSNLKSIPKNKWYIRTTPGQKKVLTYVISLPLGFPDDKAKGYMYIDVEIDHLTKLLKQVMNTPYEKLYVLDSAHQPIIATSQIDNDSLKAITNELGFSSAPSSVNVKRSEQGSQIIATLNGGDLQSFQYAIIRPLDSFSLFGNKFKKQIISSCFLIFFLGIIIAFLLSKRFYFPLKSVLHTIRRLNPIDPNHSATENEYNLINRTIHNLGQKVINLETKVKKNQLTDLLMGNLFELSGIDQIPTHCQYIAVDLQLMNASSDIFCNQIDVEDENPSFRMDWTPISKSKVALLIFASLREEQPDEWIKIQLEKIREASQVEFAASIGPSVHMIEDIPTSYREAARNLRYIYLYGHSAVVSHSQISGFSGEPIVLSFEALKNSIRAGSVGESEKILQELEISYSAPVKIEVVELSQMQLLTALSEIVMELNLHHIIPSSELFRTERTESILEMMTWIRGLVVQMADYIEAGRTKGHSELIHRVKDYIDEHLHEDLSLDLLSQLVSLSPSYISTLFADVLNVSFTEYVTKARLDKAAELLKADRSLSVADIATKVGYRNSGYFITKFRTKFGVTPMQYRNSWSA